MLNTVKDKHDYNFTNIQFLALRVNLILLVILVVNLGYEISARDHLQEAVGRVQYSWLNVNIGRFPFCKIKKKRNLCFQQQQLLDLGTILEAITISFYFSNS